MISTTLSRIRSTPSRYKSTRRLGLPVSGSRTCMCAIEAPALPASIAAFAISLGVTGIAGCLLTVSPEPVTAQVTITLPVSYTHLTLPTKA